MDIDANQDVENLKVITTKKAKVHITLRFVDLGPNDFDLICVPTNQLLANNLMVHSIDKDENERIHVEIVHRHSAYCTLIWFFYYDIKFGGNIKIKLEREIRKITRSL